MTGDRTVLLFSFSGKVLVPFRGILAFKRLTLEAFQ